MTSMHYNDPKFEIVDDDDGVIESLLGMRPIVLARSDEPPTGDPIDKDGDHTDEDDDEVLREL